MAITITVPGRPSRWMRPGQDILPDGRVIRFTDKAAEAGKKAVRSEVALCWRGRRPYTGPVLLRVIAIFAIPPSWPKALRQAASEGRVAHVSDPDIDQLVKQVMDALKGVVYVDDNQVCGLPAVSKRYGYPERTEIAIQPLAQAPDEITPGQKRLEARVIKEGWDAVLAPPKKKRSNTNTRVNAKRINPGLRRAVAQGIRRSIQRGPERR